MKTKKYAEETPNYNIETKNHFNIDYVTEAESEAIHHVLERVAEASLQSGLRFMKTLKDQEQGYEQVFLDAEDCSANVVQSIVSDLENADYSYEFKSTRQSMDHLVIHFEDESLVKEVKEDVEEEDEKDE